MATEMAEVSNRVNFGSWVGRLTCPEKSGQREYPMISGLVRKKRYGIQCPENIGPASTWSPVYRICSISHRTGHGRDRDLNRSSWTLHRNGPLRLRITYAQKVGLWNATHDQAGWLMPVHPGHATWWTERVILRVKTANIRTLPNTTGIF